MPPPIHPLPLPLPLQQGQLQWELQLEQLLAQSCTWSAAKCWPRLEPQPRRTYKDKCRISCQRFLAPTLEENIKNCSIIKQLNLYHYLIIFHFSKNFPKTLCRVILFFFLIHTFKGNPIISLVQLQLSSFRAS